MEPDVQGYATGDAPQPVDVPQNGSEAGKTPERIEAEGLKAEMLRERQARQNLEAQLSNPDFIYDQAKNLGMTNEQAQSAVDAAMETPPAKAEAKVRQQDFTWESFDKRFSQRQALEKMASDDNAHQLKEHPELESNPVLKNLYQNLSQNMRFSEAAAKVLELEDKRSSAKTPEQVEADRLTAQSTKSQATTGRTTSLTSSEANDVEATQRQIHNRNDVGDQREGILKMFKSQRDSTPS